MTPFHHEHILARTLAYERGIRQWRIAKLEAGWGDSGRPKYEEASGRLRSFGVTSALLWAFGKYTKSNHTISLPLRGRL